MDARPRVGGLPISTDRGGSIIIVGEAKQASVDKKKQRKKHRKFDLFGTQVLEWLADRFAKRPEGATKLVR